MLSSCSNKEIADPIDIEIYNEDSAVFVDYEKVETDYLCSYPECLILDSNGNLIIKDEHNKEYLFHVINLTSGNQLCEFGQKGAGPNEYMSSTLNPFF